MNYPLQKNECPGGAGQFVEESTDEETSSTAEHHSSIGTFPKRYDSVRAEVLSDMLLGKRLTSLDAVRGSNTTRLAAVVHILGDSKNGKYNWKIERCDVVVDTVDGRTAIVTEYWLSEETIQLALATGAGDYCASVREARALARKGAV